MNKPYHPANLEMLPYSPSRLIVLAWVARALGVLIHVRGMPLGDGRERGVNPVRALVCAIRIRPATNGRTRGDGLGG
jgi:hypothetical protein